MDAAGELELVVRENKTDSEILKILSRIYESTGDLMSLNRINTLRLDIEPENPEALVRKGIFLDSRDSSDKALSQYEKALKTDPENSKALERAADIYQEKGKTAKSAEYYKRALADTSSNRLLLKYSKALIAENRIDDAKKSLELITARDTSFHSAYYLLGKILMSEKNYDNAATNAGTAVKLSPDNMDYISLLADALYLAGKYPEALPQYMKIISSEKAGAEDYYRAGNILKQQKNYSKSLPLLEKARLLMPSEKKYLEEYASVSYSSKDYKKSAELYQKLLDKNPDEAVFNYRASVSLIKSGQREEALSYIRKAYGKSPEMYEGDTAAARVLYGGGEYGKAVNILETVASNDNTPVSILRLYANSLKEKGNSEKAGDIVVSMNRRNGKNDLLKEAGELYSEASRDSLSSLYYEEYLKSSPRDTSVLLKQLKYYRKKENADGTFKTLERLFAAVPDRSAYTEEYTAQLNRRNKYRESIIAAERFFKLQPSSTDAGIYLNLARAYSATGNNRSALERYSSALRYSPSDIKARREYAELLAKQGLKKKAAENYQKILESDEADTSDAYALAEIYGDLKNTEGLKKTLEKIVEMAPEDHQSRRKLADMRYLGKEYEDAISHYEILIDKNHTDAVLFINTGNIYLAGKDTSSAVKNYEAAVKADPSLDRIHYRLAGLYKATSLTDKALQSALMTVKNDSLNAGAHIMAAEIYKNKGNHKEAAASYKKASAVRPKDTEILHELAKQLVQAGSKDSSIMVYRSILTLNSDDNEAVEKLGSLLYEKAYYKKAVPHLRRSYLNSNKQKILNMLGRALYETKEYVEASKYLKKMHLLAPSEIDIQHMLAVSYLKTGEKDLALQYYLKVNREKPSLIKNEKEAAALFFNTGKYKEAERIFRNIAKTEKKDSDAFYFLGRIAEEKNPEEAIQNYEKAYNLNSEREDLVKRLGLIYASTGRDQMSLFYLNKLVEENKADEEALLALLKLYSKAGDEDNRQKTLFKLIKKDPKNPDYVKSYSRILIDKKQFDLAARYLNGAISLDPKDDESYYLRALVYEGKNWLKSARSNMALAVKYRSSNLQYRKEYGRILVKSNWHKTAAKQYEFIIRNDPKSSWAAEELLNIYKKTGNRAGLNKTAQMLAALDPNSVPARKILADRFYRSGEYSSAAVEFEKLDKIIKDDKDIKDKLAVSLYKTGKNKKALEVLTESLKMDSSNWKLQGMKGDILKKRGEKDPALEAYKLAVKHNPEDHSSHFAAAQILEEKGRAGEALVSAEKASEISAGNTDYRMLAGELNYKSGNTDDALKHLGFVISKEPKNQTANYLAGKIYLGKKRPKAAVDFLETAYMLDPASQEKAALYAEALYRAGMYTKAMPVLKKYSDGNIDLKSFLGAALYKTGKKDSAASVFSEVYGSNPDKLSGMPEAAHSLYGSGEKKKSQRILESALQAGNAEIEDRELLAEIYKENKNWEKAASVYEKLYSDNKKPEYKKQLGLVYEKSGKLSEAARALREYTSRVPRDGDAFNKLIKLYRETGNTAEINAILPKAVEADPQNPDLRFAYAEYLIQKNNYSAAEAQLNILVGKHTSHAEGFHLLGIVMINKNWLKSATTYFAKAVELAPSSTEMRKSYADILYRRELKTAAAKEYKKILENQPGDSSAVERLGEIYRKTGKENELFELYKKEYDIVKGNLQVHKFLGGIYASNNQINDAVFEYEKALEIKKTDTEVLKKLGFLYKKQGKTDRAINSYMQLSKFIEDSPEVHYRLGDLFLDDQNYTLAMMKLQECLNLDPRHKMANFKLGMVYYNLRENSREYAKKSLEYFEKYMSLGGKKENIPVEMRNYIK
ncbi:MAG: tetratricopeptide repeat protein [Fibrobacterota bacterium]